MKARRNIGGGSGGEPPPAARPSGMSYIYDRPGFLLRRCHQISVSVFRDGCVDCELTPAQFGVLYAVEQNPGTDQVAIARMIGLDRSTVSNVIDRLAARELVFRENHATDGRRRCLFATERGGALLARAFAPAAAAQERLLAPLAPEERGQLLRLLRRLMDAHAAASRVPFVPETGGPATETTTTGTEEEA